MRFAVAIVAAVVAALAVQYFLLIRPWYETWGATAGEVAAQLPGDALLPDASSVATRAITVAAPPATVWRALRASAPGAAAAQRVASVDPDRALVLRGDAGAPAVAQALPLAGTRAFVLVPQPGGSTRVLLRTRAAPAGAAGGLVAWAWRAFVRDPVAFAADRRALRDLQAHAEARPPPAPWRRWLEVALWALAAGIGATALLRLAARRPAPWRSLLTAAAALFVLTLLFFAEPHLVVGLALVAGLRWMLSWAWRVPAPAPPPATAPAG